MTPNVWLQEWFQARTQEPTHAENVNFFETGWIDSFGVMELIDAIEQNFKFRFSADNFQDRRFPTIQGLAEMIQELSPQSPTTPPDKMSAQWASFYQSARQSEKALTYPSETLVRMMRGDYLQGKPLDLAGKRVLDVGFGNGNNTAFLCSLGLEVHGIEIHSEICQTVQSSLQNSGMQAQLVVGSNQSLPYPDNHFDFLVSWNVLHYEGSSDNIALGIKEYARVLKPGGILIVSTTGPEHRILRGAKSLGNHQYEIGWGGEFRAGQIHYFFETAEFAKESFSGPFAEVQVGRTLDTLFTATLDWWIVTGVKPA